ncbi:hypothetical protein CR513_62501, partial [Mucuna pruriens]
MTLAPKKDPWWTLYIDSSSNLKQGGVGIILEGLVGITLEHSLFGFKASNNQAEYKDLLAGLNLAQEVGARQVHFRVHQGDIPSEGPLAPKTALQRFDKCKVQHVPCTNNSRADTLARLATANPPRHTILRRALLSPIVDRPKVLHTETEDRLWMIPIWNYLRRYVIEVDHLYKRGFSTPLLKCLMKTQVEYILNEIHKGIYGFHSGVAPWRHVESSPWPYRALPAKELQYVIVPWPFSMWDMDILGPFPKAKGQVKFLVIDVDYFIKWIETEPLTQITTEKVQKFNTHKVTSVEHSQVNDQAKAANKVYDCSLQSATGETPYRLTYRTNAMNPVKIGEPSPRRSFFDLKEPFFLEGKPRPRNKRAYNRQLANNGQPVDITPRSGLKTLRKTISCRGGLQTQGRRRMGNWHPIRRDHPKSENPSITMRTA